MAAGLQSSGLLSSLQALLIFKAGVLEKLSSHSPSRHFLPSAPLSCSAQHWKAYSVGSVCKVGKQMSGKKSLSLIPPLFT